MLNSRWIVLVLIVQLACTGGAEPNLARKAVPVRGQVPRLDHIWLFVMGTESYDRVIGNPAAPYTNQLAEAYGVATRYYALAHPSLPNYLAMISGATQGCTSEACAGGYSGRTLAGQLSARGLGWKGYFEDLPSPGYVGGDRRAYVRAHNPFTYFSEITSSPSMRESIRPLSDFQPQSAEAPAFSLIVPNRKHKIQGDTIDEGDRWLREHVSPLIKSSAFQRGGAIFVTWAEGRSDDQSGCCLDGVSGGRVPLISILSGGRRSYQADQSYSGYSLLRTIEDAFAVGHLGQSGAGNVKSLAELWPPRGESTFGWPARWSTAGRMDFRYGSDATIGDYPATRNKPESKLFYTPDRRWWAVFGIGDVQLVRNTGGPGVYLLELVGHEWRPRLRLPEADPWERADTVTDGRSLSIALRDNRSLRGNRRTSRLYKLHYQEDGTWKLVSEPMLITNDNPETLNIALDARGRLWVTYRFRGRIKVGVAEPRSDHFVFGLLPASAVTSDDISAIVHFGTGASGHKIGVMWSDEKAKRFMFAWRSDNDPFPDGPWHVETAYGDGVGGCPTVASDACADDHINLKSFGDVIFAAVKTGLSDSLHADPDDPLAIILRRDAVGNWSAHPISSVKQKPSRPILVIAPYLDRIFVFAQVGVKGIYVWQSPLDPPAFNEMLSLPWTVDDRVVLTDPTSTSQLIEPGAGIVVETSSGKENQYWHNEFLP
jgi:phosphatidylinositol-3-phosphatase